MTDANTTVRVRWWGDGEFCITPKAVLTVWGKYIGASGVAVYTALASFANNETGRLWPSHATIADMLDLGVGLVGETIRDMAELGLLRMEKLYDRNGRFLHNVYTLVPPPTPTIPVQLAPRFRRQNKRRAKRELMAQWEQAGRSGPSVPPPPPQPTSRPAVGPLRRPLAGRGQPSDSPLPAPPAGNLRATDSTLSGQPTGGGELDQTRTNPIELERGIYTPPQLSQWGVGLDSHPEPDTGEAASRWPDRRAGPGSEQRAASGPEHASLSGREPGAAPGPGPAAGPTLQSTGRPGEYSSASAASEATPGPEYGSSPTLEYHAASGLAPGAEPTDAYAVAADEPGEGRPKTASASGGRSRKQRERPVGDYQRRLEALASVLHMDLRLNAGKLERLLADLEAAGPPPTPERILAHYGPDDSWYFKFDWRAERGQLPTIAMIRETWGMWPVGSYRAAKVNDWWE